MERGKFIVFEGGDGSGKTSQLMLAHQYLLSKQRLVVTTHEPGGTELGQAIRELLLKQKVSPKAELALFLADRAEHIQEVILPNLAKDTTVLCDRFTGSTLAYQLGGRGLKNSELIQTMERYFRSEITPDLVIYLDVDPVLGLKRKQKQGIELTTFDQEKLDFHQRVRGYFLQLAKTQSNWAVLNSNRTLNEVQADINTKLDALL